MLMTRNSSEHVWLYLVHLALHKSFKSFNFFSLDPFKKIENIKGTYISNCLFILIFNLFYDLGNDGLAISMDEEEF